MKTSLKIKRLKQLRKQLDYNGVKAGKLAMKALRVRNEAKKILASISTPDRNLYQEKLRKLQQW